MAQKGNSVYIVYDPAAEQYLKLSVYPMSGAYGFSHVEDIFDATPFSSLEELHRMIDVDASELEIHEYYMHVTLERI